MSHKENRGEPFNLCNDSAANDQLSIQENFTMKHWISRAIILAASIIGCSPAVQNGSDEGGEMTSIYIYSDMPKPGGPYELDEDLEEFLGEEGMVSGGGSAVDGDGWNIDLEVESASAEDIIQRLIPFLKEKQVGSDTHFDVFPPDWKEGDDKRRVDVFDAGGE